MSKSKGNTVEPQQGARPIRRGRVPLVLLHVQAAVGRLPLLRKRRSARAYGCFLKQLWSTYFFYVLYAHAGAEQLASAPPEGAASDNDLDRWARSAHKPRPPRRLAARLDAYDATSAGPCDRRARRGPLELVRAPLAAALLGRRGRCVRDAARLPARDREDARAAVPFIADEIYDNLDGSLPSVHLCDFPASGGVAGAQAMARDEDLESAMRSRARPSGSASARARRRRSRCASRSARRWSSRTAASDRRSNASPT